MKLYNALTKQVEPFTPLKSGKVGLYTCGPTVYDHAHIGNMISYIMADSLRRTLTASGFKVTHVMNYTDVDDKTIKRSRERFPDLESHKALKTLTEEYIEIFNADMRRVGNDLDAIQFVRATDKIREMQQLINELFKAGVAYVADDGVYFSIDAYKKKGRTYGQLSEISTSSTAKARVQNDEYDKESAHDFALWKTQKHGEPAWPFELDGHKLDGRPGWHIECSVMSTGALGQPFDIHTGGVDLIFPHHENEIAQSTAAGDSKEYAKFFTHNEHILIDGRKMAKSLGNFYTIENVVDNDLDPLSYRLMVLQSHYRSQSNFTWENVAAAENRLNRWRNMAELRWQPLSDADSAIQPAAISVLDEKLQEAMANDLDTPGALAIIDEVFRVVDAGVPKRALAAYKRFLQNIDDLLGLDLMQQADLSDDLKTQIAERLAAKHGKDFVKADSLRADLEEQGIEVRDTPYASLWNRLYRAAEHTNLD